MIGLIGLWSHALAAILFAALAIWQLRNWRRDPLNRPLIIAFAATSLWAFCVATMGPHSLLAGITQSGRNFAFLAFMYAIVRTADGDERRQAEKAVYAVVAGVIGCQLTLAGVLPEFNDQPIIHAALAATAQIIGLTVAAGSLVLVHNLYGKAAPDSRWGIRLPMIALAAMWTYDLHLNTVAYLTREPVDDLLAMRGAILAMLVPLFALASRRNAQWRMQISRAATFQSLSLLAILIYLILMMSATSALQAIGGDWVRIGQIAIVFALTVVAVILLPSGRMRAWSRVILAKHLFEHRYDYREEWLRFTRTIGVAGEDEAPLGVRVVKALADIADSPAGLLLVPDENGLLSVGARWNWDDEIPRNLGDPDFVRFLESSSHVLDFSEIRRTGASGENRIRVPEWMARPGPAWAGIPLLHSDRLVGLVILQHPLIRRELDWEDFDLFRTAGIQAASYLAEARGQEALANAQRFDEFNRRFAFIMHDIKNLVSQLSLVASNASRHAHNPEFREDMIATLQASVKKMNDLLDKLSRGNNGDAEAPRSIEVDRVISAVVEMKRRVHPVAMEPAPDIFVLADPIRLEQALAHLLQNAIDASDPAQSVSLRTKRRDGEAVIQIADRGSGMSADFIRTRLFQPFSSTKDGGFGIGAYEARTLIAAMRGRLEVESREGEGTCFTIYLPLGDHSPATAKERMRA